MSDQVYDAFGNVIDSDPDYSPGAYTRKQQDEVRITSSTGGQKGQKDIQLHGMPWESLQALGKVYAMGAAKYDDGNFRKGYAWSLSFDAMLRHMFSFWAGEELDPESGLPHTAHAAWHALTLGLFSSQERYDEFDDRPWKGDLITQLKQYYADSGN